MVVLVGGSSTGKTRACWETMRGLSEPWLLWHPLRPDRPEAVLAKLETIGAHLAEKIEYARLLKAQGESPGQIAAKTGIPKTSLHRYLSSGEVLMNEAVS
ncbi:hypothetical protein OHA77_39735 [Streptosporangium sp. NBC_01639]|uniref:helix-turn-helix domain-containing protein n=1 Tax=Streptosporangium sp. NBC_01639 TaxID=2975948 RepID=UPI003865233F|nr:hypothetical protein OHA77_39735 [Streptosporangium sp. NBC_01639]